MRDIDPSTLGSLRDLHSLIVNNVELELELTTLLQDVSLGNMVTATTSQLDFLKNLVKMKTATPKIQSLAMKICGTDQRSPYWERKILIVRIRTKTIELRDRRRQWARTSEALERKIPAQYLAGYKAIKKKELNQTWEQEKRHKKRKIGWATGRILTDYVAGIPLTDQALAAKYGEKLDHEGLVIGGDTTK